MHLLIVRLDGERRATSCLVSLAAERSLVLEFAQDVSSQQIDGTVWGS